MIIKSGQSDKKRLSFTGGKIQQWGMNLEGVPELDNQPAA